MRPELGPDAGDSCWGGTGTPAFFYSSTCLCLHLEAHALAGPAAYPLALGYRQCGHQVSCSRAACLFRSDTVCCTCSTVHLVSIVGNHGTFARSLGHMLSDMELLYHVTYLTVCVLGLVGHPLLYSVLLLDVLYQEETLLNVIKSVTRNGRSIILTAVLALILVYLFSIVAFLFFRDDFLVQVDRSVSRSIDGGCFALLRENRYLTGETQHALTVALVSLPWTQ